MRTLLRHSLTGQYYQSLGKWTTNPDRAHDFGVIAHALEFAHSTKSPNLEVNLSFSSPQQAAAFRFKDLVGNF